LKAHDSAKPSKALLDAIKNRIDWEVFNEYGFMSLIGRTLPLTGCSVATPDLHKLEKTLDELYPQVINRQGSLWKTDKNDLRQCLLGLLNQLKSKGAIFHPALEN